MNISGVIGGRCVDCPEIWEPESPGDFKFHTIIVNHTSKIGVNEEKI
jgi:hypothetical protein